MRKTFCVNQFEGIPPFRAMHLEEGYNPAKVGELYRKASGFVRQKPWDTFNDEIDNLSIIKRVNINGIV